MPTSKETALTFIYHAETMQRTNETIFAWNKNTGILF